MGPAVTGLSCTSHLSLSLSLSLAWTPLHCAQPSLSHLSEVKSNSHNNNNSTLNKEREQFLVQSLSWLHLWVTGNATHSTTSLFALFSLKFNWKEAQKPFDHGRTPFTLVSTLPPPKYEQTGGTFALSVASPPPPPPPARLALHSVTRVTQFVNKHNL